MKKIFASKKSGKAFWKFLTSKTAYIILLLIILIQFTLISIIFFQNIGLRKTINSRVSSIESKQNLILEKMNAVQAVSLRLNSLLQRTE